MLRYEKLNVFHTSSPSLVAVLQKEWLFFMKISLTAKYYYLTCLKNKLTEKHAYFNL